MSPIQPDLLRADDFPVAFGRYTLLGLLGEGGMARVFRAELQGPSGFRKAAAVKIIRASVAARSEALRVSLINEARLGGLLHHPNIVDTYDYGEVDDLPYIAMELVRGLGLDELLVAVKPLPPSLAVEIGAQICAGLDHAHSLEDAGVDTQLVHRDLKPSNVIVSRDGLVKVMDFGIAKATMISEGNTETGMTKGTPAYMSPEQVGGEDLDPRSDLFAMGAILYELVTGERLFGGDSIMSVLMGVVRVEERMAEPGVLEAVDARAPGMAPIILRCLKKDREQRFGDAADLEHALRLVARELPPPPPLKKFVRRLMKPVGAAPPVPRRPTPPGAVGTLPQTLQAPAPPASEGPLIAATVPQVLAVPSPIPPAPPSTPLDVVGPTRAQIASMEQVPTRSAPPDRKERRSLPPWLLLLLGLLLGGGAAVGGVLWLSRTPAPGRAPDDPTPVETAARGPDVPSPVPPLTEARSPAPALGDRSPAATPTPVHHHHEASEPSPAPADPTPLPSESSPAPADPTPLPSESSPAPADPTPLPSEPREPAVAAPDPDATPHERADQQLAERAAREEARRVRRQALQEEAKKERLAQQKAREEAARAAAVPDPRTTPAPGVPSPHAAASAGTFRVATASARSRRDDEGALTVRFSARVVGPDIKDVTAHFNPRGASWIARPMRSRDGSRYVVAVGFKPRNEGPFHYYVTARDSEGEEVSRGSEDRPLEAVAE